MAQLIVRNLDSDLVRRLKRRAAENGHSMEEEHRQLLRAALRNDDFLERLLAMPEAGSDADFQRQGDLPRDISL